MKVIDKTLNPVWNEKSILSVQEVFSLNTEAYILLECWDEEYGRGFALLILSTMADDFEGLAEVDLKPVVQQRTVDAW